MRTFLKMLTLLGVITLGACTYHEDGGYVTTSLLPPLEASTEPASPVTTSTVRAAQNFASYTESVIRQQGGTPLLKIFIEPGLISTANRSKQQHWVDSFNDILSSSTTRGGIGAHTAKAVAAGLMKVWGVDWHKDRGVVRSDSNARARWEGSLSRAYVVIVARIGTDEVIFVNNIPLYKCTTAGQLDLLNINLSSCPKRNF